MLVYILDCGWNHFNETIYFTLDFFYTFATFHCSFVLQLQWFHTFQPFASLGSMLAENIVAYIEII